MLKKMFGVSDCKGPKDAAVKGVVMGLAIWGAVRILSDCATIIVRIVVREEIERLK